MRNLASSSWKTWICLPLHHQTLSVVRCLKVALHSDSRHADQLLPAEYQRQPLPLPGWKRCFPQQVFKAAARTVAVWTQTFPALAHTDHQGLLIDLLQADPCAYTARKPEGSAKLGNGKLLFSSPDQMPVSRGNRLNYRLGFSYMHPTSEAPDFCISENDMQFCIEARGEQLPQDFFELYRAGQYDAMLRQRVAQQVPGPRETQFP